MSKRSKDEKIGQMKKKYEERQANAEEGALKEELIGKPQDYRPRPAAPQQCPKCRQLLDASCSECHYCGLVLEAAA